VRVILLRFGELYLKGNNRNIFENLLITNIKKKLEGESFKFEKTFGRYLITNYNEDYEDQIVEKLKKVFGLYSLSRALEVHADVEIIKSEIAKYEIGDKSFKVYVKRADKNFPVSSMDFARLSPSDGPCTDSFTAKSPLPPLLQKIHPLVSRLPSLLGQERPASTAILYIFWP